MSVLSPLSSNFGCFRKSVTPALPAPLHSALIDVVNAIWQHQVVAYYGNQYFDLRRGLPVSASAVDYGIDELVKILHALGSSPNPFAEGAGYGPEYLQSLGLYVPWSDTTTAVTLPNLHAAEWAEWEKVPAGVKALAFLRAAAVQDGT